MDQRDLQFSIDLAFELSSFRRLASCGCSAVSTSHLEFGIAAVRKSAIHETGFVSFALGPKFQAPYHRSASRHTFSATRRYPASGSRTCCHGRTASGDLTRRGFCESSVRRKSGISLSCAQSPPPMTLPALPVASPIPDSLKNDCQ